MVIFAPIFAVMAHGGFDRYPQPLILNTSTTSAAPNTSIGITAATPVVQVGQRTFIMNILAVEWNVEEPDYIESTDTNVTATIQNQSLVALPSEDPRIVSRVDYSLQAEDAALTGKAVAVVTRNQMIPYHDGDGHGQLYAGSSINLVVSGSNNTEGKFASARIWYTLVSVSAAELIGILRGQGK